MKRKELERIIEMLWPSHTTKDGTVYAPLTPKLFTKLWLEMDEVVGEYESDRLRRMIVKHSSDLEMVEPHLKEVD